MSEIGYARQEMKVGDPPAIPTPIDKCPKCGKHEGWNWVWSKEILNGNGYSVCKSCKAEFH